MLADESIGHCGAGDCKHQRELERSRTSTRSEAMVCLLLHPTCLESSATPSRSSWMSRGC